MMAGLGFMMIFGGLLFILFWVVVIGGAIWLIAALARGGHTNPSTPAGGSTLLSILQSRYANGEITKEQFEQMKRDLSA